ncbi:biliverdin-producing heme oxygenase, partial [Acinetobacter baumannii]|nr:biliverdin-producing heme oxygenase [Acinetobacter baumannii]
MMNSSTEQIISNSLSLRLKQETAAEHERMHQLMSEAKVFSSKEKYAQFTLSQYYFQREIEHLFEKEGVAGLIPDLDIRGRSK